MQIQHLKFLKRLFYQTLFRELGIGSRESMFPHRPLLFIGTGIREPILPTSFQTNVPYINKSFYNNKKMNEIN